MEQEFTEEELRDVLLSAETGFRVREEVASVMGADTGPMLAAREALSRMAHNRGLTDWIMEADGKLVPEKGFDEVVEISDPSGTKRVGRVLDTTENTAVVQVLEGTTGLSNSGTRVRFLALLRCPDLTLIPSRRRDAGQA